MASIPTLTVVEDHTGLVVETKLPNGAGEGPADADKKEIRRLRSKHPDYEANESHWRFLLMSYEGGPDYASEDTLFKHQREQKEDYRDRLKRAHYQNYCCPIVDYVPEFIFNHPIERDATGDIKEAFDNFIHNVDRNGTNLDKFMQQVSEDARLFGHCFVQVDKPSVPAAEKAALSAYDVQQQGLDQPYLIAVRPLEVLDWRTDQFGNYVYIKRVEYTSVVVGNDIVDIERYTEWTRKSFKVSMIDISDRTKEKLLPAETSENAWNVVPFIQIFNKRSKSNRDLGISAIQDIAYQNRDVFNLTSLIGEFLYRQAFNILVMEEDNSVPERSKVEGSLGTSNVLTYPTGVKNAPNYLTPPADPAEFIQSERAKTIQEMYRQAAQDVASELFAASNRSGDAAKQAFGRTVPVIAKAADVLQQAEVQILHLWAKLQSKQWKGKIAYKDSFEITNLQDLVLQLSMIFNSLRVMSPTFIREEWRRIVREFDGRIERETLDKIFTEIDNISDEKLLGYYEQDSAVPTNDIKSTEGIASTAQMIQGEHQARLGSDKKITMATGSRASTKEATPDANKRANTANKRR